MSSQGVTYPGFGSLGKCWRTPAIQASLKRRAPSVPGESILECAARELKEESGATAVELRPLGDFAITLGSTARVHLYEARGLTLGPQELTASETDFQLTWWTMADAVDAAVNGRFLLPAGPLALFMASRQESDAGWVPAPGH
ncbi:hypothetical protein GCM10023205_29540 [Yinghuangia aomiensis]|uniref:Nudix hydrolase domain-containing protein n=1 Tax=Yinghuangia aomiensis TaxID=676205 RepID=A0ABP9H880_9ACTN